MAAGISTIHFLFFTPQKACSALEHAFVVCTPAISHGGSPLSNIPINRLKVRRINYWKRFRLCDILASINRVADLTSSFRNLRQDQKIGGSRRWPIGCSDWQSASSTAFGDRKENDCHHVQVSTGEKFRNGRRTNHRTHLPQLRRLRKLSWRMYLPAASRYSRADRRAISGRIC